MPGGRVVYLTHQEGAEVLRQLEEAFPRLVEAKRPRLEGGRLVVPAPVDYTPEERAKRAELIRAVLAARE